MDAFNQNTKEPPGMLLGCLGFTLLAGYGLLQAITGYMGLSDTIGSGWAIFLAFLLIITRSSIFFIPFIIGAFFYAKDTWEWHWIFALTFACPSLIFFTVPSIIEGIVSLIRRH